MASAAGEGGGATMALSREASALYRVRKTVCKMLKNRQYNVASADANMTPEQFATDFTAHDTGAVSLAQMTVSVALVTDPNEKIMVFFPAGTNIGVPAIKQFAEHMKENKTYRGILVVAEKITPFALKCIQDLEPKYRIEYFKQAELLVDITEHTLVPQHILLTEEEKATLLARYKLKDNQLPRIQFDDPVARYYGLHRGQVVKIVRPSETAGRYVTYRLVQ